MCLTLCDPMDCSPARLFCPRNTPGKNTGMDCHSLLKGIFPTQASNPGLLHSRQIFYHLSHQWSPYEPFVIDKTPLLKLQKDRCNFVVTKLQKLEQTLWNARSKDKDFYGLESLVNIWFQFMVLPLFFLLLLMFLTDLISLYFVTWSVSTWTQCSGSNPSLTTYFLCDFEQMV